MECEFESASSCESAYELADRLEQLRIELQRYREESKRLQENNRMKDQHISILTSTCQQFVEELESTKCQSRKTSLALLTPPDSRTSLSSLPEYGFPSSDTNHQMEQGLPVYCSRCQQLECELAQTREELNLIGQQLQCAVQQKFKLQEKLCSYEDDMAFLVEKDLSHKSV